MTAKEYRINRIATINAIAEEFKQEDPVVVWLLRTAFALLGGFSHAEAPRMEATEPIGPGDVKARAEIRALCDCVERLITRVDRLERQPAHAECCDLEARTRLDQCLTNCIETNKDIV